MSFVKHEEGALNKACNNKVLTPGYNEARGLIKRPPTKTQCQQEAKRRSYEARKRGKLAPYNTREDEGEAVPTSTEHAEAPKFPRGTSRTNQRTRHGSRT